MPDTSAGPSGWWGIAFGLLSLALAAYREWAHHNRWKKEDARRINADVESKRPKLKFFYIKAERPDGRSMYSAPGFKIENVGIVPVTHLKIELLFDQNTSQEIRRLTLSRFNPPSNLPVGTSYEYGLNVNDGTIVSITLVVNADGMEEIRWTHEYVRG